MIARLREIFARHATDGKVRMDYLTKVRFGRLDN